jgi:hypothetical protein
MRLVQTIERKAYLIYYLELLLIIINGVDDKPNEKWI